MAAKNVLHCEGPCIVSRDYLVLLSILLLLFSSPFPFSPWPSLYVLCTLHINHLDMLLHIYHLFIILFVGIICYIRGRVVINTVCGFPAWFVALLLNVFQMSTPLRIWDNVPNSDAIRLEQCGMYSLDLPYFSYDVFQGFRSFRVSTMRMTFPRMEWLSWVSFFNFMSGPYAYLSYPYLLGYLWHLAVHYLVCCESMCFILSGLLRTHPLSSVTAMTTLKSWYAACPVVVLAKSLYHAPCSRNSNYTCKIISFRMLSG